MEIFAQEFRLFPFNKFRHDGLVHALLLCNAAATLSTATLSCSSFEKEAIFHFDICITGLLYRKISLIIRLTWAIATDNERRVRGAGGAATFSGRRSLPGFSRGRKRQRFPCTVIYRAFPLKNEMAANIDGTLTGHVFADFIHHLRSGQFLLTASRRRALIRAFVLSQDIAALWCSCDFFLNRRGPPDSNQLLNT